MSPNPSKDWQTALVDDARRKGGVEYLILFLISDT